MLRLLAIGALGVWTSFCVGIGYGLGKPTDLEVNKVTTARLKVLLKEDESFSNRACTLWWFGMTSKERTIKKASK